MKQRNWGQWLVPGTVSSSDGGTIAQLGEEGGKPEIFSLGYSGESTGSWILGALSSDLAYVGGKAGIPRWHPLTRQESHLSDGAEQGDH